MAINTFDDIKRVFLIKSPVGYEQLTYDFELGDGTEVWDSCSLQWQNKYYVFGGYNKQQQVSMLNGNRLERKGQIDFYFTHGTCTVFNQIIIVLCFTKAEHKVCRQSNNPLGSFAELPNSNYKHFDGCIASFDGKNIFS